MGLHGRGEEHSGSHHYHEEQKTFATFYYRIGLHLSSLVLQLIHSKTGLLSVVKIWMAILSYSFGGNGLHVMNGIETFRYPSSKIIRLLVN